ncbi:MAG: glycoside hydrolase family 3 [Ktedonobacteraceae bacterium]|nr:glycoside hydrolase family 3 [Ktedonobacteraceae bacterium]
MYAKQPICQQFMRIHSQYILILCFLTLLLSGCGDVQVLLPTTSQLGPQKADAHGIATEATRRAQLTKVQQIMQGMSLDQKLGQLLMVEYIGTDYQTTGLQYMIAQQFVGGYLYQPVNNNFAAPHDTVGGVTAFVAQAMRDAKIPLLIAVDQEGGQVNKLQTFYGALPAAASIAASGDPNAAWSQAAQDAKRMHELGINTDLAPVVDVGPTTNLLQDRQFSSDPTTVATYAGAFLNGLQKNTIVACLKHFPGLGSLPNTVGTDPHFHLPVVDRSLTDLENIDLAPYKTILRAATPAMIMPTDVLTTAIDADLPAELSPKAIDGVLRKELGYDGVVITDGLYMQGIISRWPLSQAAVLSILAGDDLIEGPYTPNQVAEVVAALKRALQQGQLSMQRIDQSVRRILLMKVQYGIIN